MWYYLRELFSLEYVVVTYPNKLNSCIKRLRKTKSGREYVILNSKYTRFLNKNGKMDDEYIWTYLV